MGFLKKLFGSKAIEPQVEIMKIGDQEYKTVKIGNQIWMAENLKVTHYRNGNEIPTMTSNNEWSVLDKGARCSYNNDEFYARTYGYLYNWFAILDDRNIAPEGWHVPTDEEWKELEMYLGMSQSVADKEAERGTDEGGKLKEIGTTHRNSPNEGTTNETGFSALLGGDRYPAGSFADIGRSSLFWSSTEGDNDKAWCRRLNDGRTDISRGNYPKQYGFSVRLLRD